MSDPTTPEGRAELRQMLEDGKRDHWEVCTDGRTIGEDAGDDMAKWIGEAGPCAAELIVAAVNALPALLDALDKVQRDHEENLRAGLRHMHRAEKAEAVLARVRDLSKTGECWGGSDALEEFIRRLNEITGGAA